MKKNNKKNGKGILLVFSPFFLYGILFINIISNIRSSSNDNNPTNLIINLLIYLLIYIIFLGIFYFLLLYWDRIETKKIDEDLNKNILFIIMDEKNEPFKEYVKNIFIDEEEIDLFKKLPFDKNISEIDNEVIFLKLDYVISNLKNQNSLRNIIEIFLVSISVLSLVTALFSNVDLFNQSLVHFILLSSSLLFIMFYLQIFIMQDYLDKKRNIIINKLELLKCRLKIDILSGDKNISVDIINRMINVKKICEFIKSYFT